MEKRRRTNMRSMMRKMVWSSQRVIKIEEGVMMRTRKKIMRMSMIASRFWSRKQKLTNNTRTFRRMNKDESQQTLGFTFF